MVQFSLNIYNTFTVRGSDFVYFSEAVTVPACDQRFCTGVEILDGCVLEDTEEFQVSLLESGLDSDICVGEDSSITITITDDDGNNQSCIMIRYIEMLFLLMSSEVDVSMEFTEYTAEEDGGAVQLCAVVTCGVPFSFTIYASTSDGTGIFINSTISYITPPLLSLVVTQLLLMRIIILWTKQ